MTDCKWSHRNSGMRLAEGKGGLARHGKGAGWHQRCQLSPNSFPGPDLSSLVNMDIFTDGKNSIGFDNGHLAVNV